MSIAAVQQKHVFGVKGDVVNNIAYLDEQNILYPSGAVCVLYNIDLKSQKFIPCSASGTSMTAMGVAPNRRYAAVADKGEKPSVTVLDLHTLRKRKALTLPDMKSQEFVSISFSPDSKYVIAQGGGPDWILGYWGWEKTKLMATIKTTNQLDSPIRQVSFNPRDNTSICVVGDSIYKHFRYSEGNLKQHSFQKSEPLNYLSHAWISDTHLLLGTDAGKVQLFEGGELKNEFEVVVTPDNSRSSSQASSKAPEFSKEPIKVKSIITYSKGFICSGGMGVLHLFEKTEEKYGYKKVRSVSVNWTAQPEIPDALVSAGREVLNMVLSPSEENVICTTQSQQIYCLPLSAADLGKVGGSSPFDYLGQSFHSSHITGMDVCLRKPIFATCSLDRTVRIWNYETMTLEVWKEFQEEAHSIAVHPSGLFVLVGFSEKLRLMNILIDDVRVFKEISIRGCRECRFSNGGHVLAAANSNLIQIYSTYSFENVGNLKGHSGKVRSIQWSSDDTRLVTCSTDGAVYDWNLQSYQREYDCVVKNCSYTSISVTADLKATFAVGSDCTLKEISLADSSVTREIPSGPVALTQVCLSHSGRMMFAGTSTGCIRAIKYPLGETGEWQEYQAHSAAVSKMCISYDDQYMFSVGEDGSIFVFKITDKDGRGLKRDREVVYSEEILITKSDLEEKNTLMSELKTRVEELRMENEYQLRLKDMNHNEKVKEMSDKFQQEMEALKSKHTALQLEKEQLETKHDDELQEIREKHGQEVHDLENAHSQKLMNEYEKYQELQARNQKLQEDYERQLSTKEDSHSTAQAELTEFYEGKLLEKAHHLEQVQVDKKQQQKEADEMRRQIEEDGDREILDLRNRYERKLREEKEENIRLRGDYGIMKKKVDSLQSEIDDKKTEIQKQQNELKKRDAIIASLRSDIDGLKREIQERDDTIQEKEKRIYDLKKKNQELEKFKFVLDYKIKELRRQMEPKENEIKSMKEQIRKMEAELEEQTRDNKALQLAMDKQERRLQASNTEMLKERQKVQDLRVEIQNIKAGLHGTTRFIQEPTKLKDSVKELYRKYLRDFERGSQADQSAEKDMHAEYTRQRQHLEHSLGALRKKLTKDTEIHRMDNIRVMQENVTLLKEVNDLRKELKVSRTQLHDLEAALKILQKNLPEDGTVAKSTSTLRSARETMGPIGGLAQPEAGPNDQTRIIEMQRTEISKLRSRIVELQTPTRTHSATRLPPMTVP